MSEKKRSTGEFLDAREFGEMTNLNRESIYKAIARASYGRSESDGQSDFRAIRMTPYSRKTESLMRDRYPVWLTWEELYTTAAVSGKLIRNPENPFEAFDEYGEPCLPMTLGDDSPSDGDTSSPCGNPPGGVDLHTGKMTAAILAPHLHWGSEVCAKAHEHKPLVYRGRPVPIDMNIVPLVEAMWRAGFMTLACCEGDDTDTETGYVMFSEEVGKRFMEWCQAREEDLPQGLVHHFDIVLQDDEWHSYMGDRYPLLQPVELDVDGRLFTLCWRFHRQELLDHRDLLVSLLRISRPEPSCSIRQ